MTSSPSMRLDRSMWVDANHQVHNIADMTPRYRENCMRMMVRAAPKIVANEYDEMFHFHIGPMGFTGEHAVEQFEREMDAVFDLVDTLRESSWDRRHEILLDRNETYQALVFTCGPPVSDDRIIGKAMIQKVKWAEAIGSVAGEPITRPVGTCIDYTTHTVVVPPSPVCTPEQPF